MDAGHHLPRASRSRRRRTGLLAQVRDEPTLYAVDFYELMIQRTEALWLMHRSHLAIHRFLRRHPECLAPNEEGERLFRQRLLPVPYHQRWRLTTLSHNSEPTVASIRWFAADPSINSLRSRCDRMAGGTPALLQAFFAEYGAVHPPVQYLGAPPPPPS